jgi:hypothetical protein
MPNPKKAPKVKVNEHGRRIGEHHPSARLTDHEVELIRELLEAGIPPSEIVAKFDRMVTRQQIWRIATYRSRAHYPADVRPLLERVCGRCGTLFRSVREFQSCPDCRKRLTRNIGTRAEG